METGAFYRYVMTFTKTTHTVQTAQNAQALFPNANVIPVPNQISKSCGLAIEFPTWEPVAQRHFFDNLAVPAYLYRLTMTLNASGAYRILAVEETPPQSNSKGESCHGDAQQI